MFRSWRRYMKHGKAGRPHGADGPASARGRRLEVELLEDRRLLSAAPGPYDLTGLTLVVPVDQSFIAPVARFRTDETPDYRVSVDWGDGHLSAGSLRTVSDHTFDVVGDTTYHQAGTFAVTTALTRDDGSTFVIRSYAVVTANVSGEATTIYADVRVGAPPQIPTATGGSQIAVGQDQTGGVFTFSTPQGPGLPPGREPPPAPPPDLAPGTRGAIVPAAAAASPRAHPLAGVSVTPRRDVDPSTFVLWSSQRDQGATARQTLPAAAPVSFSPPLAGAGGPGRLDVEEYFAVADRVNDVPTPVRFAADVEARPAGAVKPPLLDDDLLAVLARARAPVVTTADESAEVPPEPGQAAAVVAPSRAEDSAGGKDNFFTLATAWVLLQALFYGVWQTGDDGGRAAPTARK